MTTYFQGALLACVSVAALVMPTAGIAQQSPGSESVLDGEIVITAQKRDEKLQNVGIAVAAYSGDQLRALGIDKSSDIATFTPGVHISGSLAGQNTQFTIRGVTQNDFNDIVEAPNAVYLDEGYIAIAQGQSFAVFDIDRVEILKGPQGTLFGRNATGGLVHYLTRKPSLTKWEGYIDAKYGVMDSVDNPSVFTIEGAAGGPVSEKIAVRGAFRWNKQQPYLRNQYPNQAVGAAPGPGAGANLGDDDTLAGRLSVLVAPSDRSEFILSGNYSRSRVATGPYQQKPTIAVYSAAGELIDVRNAGPNETRASIIPVGTPGSINGDNGSDLNNDGIVGGPGEIYGRPAGGDFFGYHDPDGAGNRFSSDFAFKDSGHVETWGIGLRGHIDLSDSITLTSITDYKHFTHLLFIDVDGGPANQLANYTQLKADQASEELRLSGSGSGYHWVAGFYYLHINNLTKDGLKAPPNSSASPGFPIDIASTAHLKTDSYSIFGQGDYDLTSRLRVVAGARIIREQKNYDFIQEIFFSPDARTVQPGTALFPVGPLSGPDPRYRDKRGQTLWAGKVQLEYRPTEDALLYFGVNRGTKAGSYNAQLNGGLPTPPSAIRYGDETLTNYEGGFKLAFADRKIRLNGSVYYYDYKNYQSFLFTGVSGVVINADARTVGGELTLQANPFRGFDIALSVSKLDAKVKNVPLRVGGPIVRDVKPTYAPENQASALVRYAWAMFGGTMAVKGDAAYSSSYYYNLRNFSADRYGGYVLVDAGVSWTTRDDHLELGFDVSNLTDKRIGIQGFDLATLCGCNEVSYKLPRTFSVRARYNF